MCGISGIISFKGGWANMPEEILGINKAIKHRGPDGEGFVFINSNDTTAVYSEDTPDSYRGSNIPFAPKKNIHEINEEYNVVLAHRRLSIIDLSITGHQPMCTADKKLWITYNGEIYNYVELKKELQQYGYSFFTNSDTEVILNAYKHWGKECLSRFNGMWAFALYDSNINELFVARDRFGVKPFYYYKDESYFVFASEQKALVQSGIVKTEINPAAIFDYFVKGELEVEEEGVFNNIIELFPSYAFTLNTQNGNIQKWKYYTLTVNEKFEPFNEKLFTEAKEKTKELLINAVSLRLRSDVPVGSCLSGGIDSSVIVGIINHLLREQKNINVGEKLKVFTASFANKQIDESKWAALMVKKTEAEWHKVSPTPYELINDLEELIYSQDEPIWSTSTYAQHRVMKIAKESGIKVVLDGQGGDELFGGYNTQLPSFWIELLRNGKWAKSYTEIKNSEGLKFFLKQYLKQNILPNTSGATQTVFAKNFYSDVNYLNKDFFETYKSRIKPTGHKNNNLNKTLHNEFYNSRLKVYLKCEDRCSMWHSVESRTPFADDIHLIEYVFNLPASYKIKNGISKYLLREAADSFIAPEIKNRTDKMGYVTPNNEWIKKIAPSFADIITSGKSDFINTEKVKTDFEKFFSPEGETDKGRIFKYLCFPIWKQKFNL